MRGKLPHLAELRRYVKKKLGDENAMKIPPIGLDIEHIAHLTPHCATLCWAFLWPSIHA